MKSIVTKFYTKKNPIIQKYKLLHPNSTVAEKVAILQAHDQEQDTDNVPLTGEDIKKFLAIIRNDRSLQLQDDWMIFDAITEYRMPALESTSNQPSPRRLALRRNQQVIDDALATGLNHEQIQDGLTSGAIPQEEIPKHEYNIAEAMLRHLCLRGHEQVHIAKRIIENPNISIDPDVIASIGDNFLNSAIDHHFLDDPKFVTAFLNSERVDEIEINPPIQLPDIPQNPIIDDEFVPPPLPKFVRVADNILRDHDAALEHRNLNAEALLEEENIVQPLFGNPSRGSLFDNEGFLYNPQDIAALRDARVNLLLRRRNANNEN